MYLGALSSIVEDYYSPRVCSFRTHVNPTLFSYYLQRYSDIYTSSLSVCKFLLLSPNDFFFAQNLADYPMDYCFYPSRSYLPHEFTLGRTFLDVRWPVNVICSSPLLSSVSTGTVILLFSLLHRIFFSFAMLYRTVFRTPAVRMPFIDCVELVRPTILLNAVRTAGL